DEAPATGAEQFREVVEGIETKISEADGKHIAEVTIIRAGTSKNGNHYPSEVLQESMPLFEGARAFADHGKPGDLPERSVRDLVGYYRYVRMEDAQRVPDPSGRPAAGRRSGAMQINPAND